VDDLQPGVEAELLGRLDLGRARPAGARLGDEIGDVGSLGGKRLGDRVPRRNGDEAGAENRFRPGGEHLYRSEERRVGKKGRTG